MITSFVIIFNFADVNIGCVFLVRRNLWFWRRLQVFALICLLNTRHQTEKKLCCR